MNETNNCDEIIEVYSVGMSVQWITNIFALPVGIPEIPRK